MGATASDDQKKAVKNMVDKMKNPTIKPVNNMSYTLGWDVVASFSEVQINSLLEDRHKKENNDMLKLLAFDHKIRKYTDDEDEDDNAEPKYLTRHYVLKFGAPLIQFNTNATATSTPTCSIQMKIVDCKYQTDGSSKVREVPKGWSVKLNNIPLGTVRGRLNEGGQVQHDGPSIIPGHKPVHFDFSKEQQQNVVLAFDMDRSLVKVEPVPPEGTNPHRENHIATQQIFHTALESYFCGPLVVPDGLSEEERESLTRPRAFSYSIASLNNKSNDDTPELTPEKFQVATFASPNKEVHVLSIFVQCKGSTKKGQEEKLQTSWDAQWHQNGMGPIPEGFTASLILSPALVVDVILSRGFKKANWKSIEDKSPKDEALLKVECRSLDHFTVAPQDYRYGQSSKFHVDGFDVKLEEWPMTMHIQQKDSSKPPVVSAYWYIEAYANFEATYQWLGFGTTNTSANGTVRPRYRLCDADNYANPREIKGAEFTIKDDKIELDLKLDTLNEKEFRMDQDLGNQIEFATWEKGMNGLWSVAPKVTMSSFDIGFLRTTNLLMPGQRVIDFNSKIGIQTPKDWLLVGDVVRA